MRINKKTVKQFIEHVNFRKGTDNEAINYGLMGEIGEVTDLIKKYKFYGLYLDLEKLTEEVGDVLFYWGWFFVSISENLESSIDDFSKFLEYLITEKFLRGIDLEDSMYKTICAILSSTIDEYHLDINEILLYNIEKLEKRYPDGFDKERSKNRK